MTLSSPCFQPVGPNAPRTARRNCCRQNGVVETTNTNLFLPPSVELNQPHQLHTRVTRCHGGLIPPPARSVTLRVSQSSYADWRFGTWLCSSYILILARTQSIPPVTLCTTSLAVGAVGAWEAFAHSPDSPTAMNSSPHQTLPPREKPYCREHTERLKHRHSVPWPPYW